MRFLLSGISLLALPGHPRFSPAAPDGARLTGLVRFLGDTPKAQPIDFSACPDCAAENAGKAVVREDLVVNPNGTLRNALVFLRGSSPALAGRAFPPPAEPAAFEVRGGIMRPHVLALRAGQPLAIRNFTSHGVQWRCAARRNPTFSISSPTPSEEIVKTFDREEVAIRIAGEPYPWTGAWVAVLQHPFFALTGEEGDFLLGDLPPGDVELAVWHEMLGEQAQAFSLAAGETRRVEFSFRPPPRR